MPVSPVISTVLDVAATVSSSWNRSRMMRLLPDHAVDPIPLLELRPEIGVLRLQPPLLDRRSQHVQQRVELERLGDEIRRPLLDGLDCVFHGPVAGDDDGDDVGVAFEGGVEDFPAADARQPQVGDQNVEGEVGQPLQRVLAVARLLDDEPVVRQTLGNRRAERPLVIHDQQMFLIFRHLERATVF